jgi:hypothetical protein
MAQLLIDRSTPPLALGCNTEHNNQLSTSITTRGFQHDLYYHISQEVKPQHSNPYDNETGYTFTTPYAEENSNPYVPKEVWGTEVEDQAASRQHSTNTRKKTTNHYLFKLSRLLLPSSFEAKNPF